MSLQVLRYEGPPESGKTTEACRFLHMQNLIVPSHAETGTEDVSLLSVRDLMREPDPGKPVDPEAAEESIDRVMFQLREQVKPAALIISNTRSMFTLAGEHAARILNYLHAAAENAGFQFLVMEDTQPSTLRFEEDARKQWASLPWLCEAEAKHMPPCTALNMDWLIPSLWQNVSPRLLVRYTLSITACELAGYRVGPVQRIFDTAARAALAQATTKTGPIEITADHLLHAAAIVLAERQREHAAKTRGALYRNPESHALARYVASGAKAREGVLLSSNAARAYLEAELKRTVHNGAHDNAARWLVRDNVVWLAGDGRAFIADALLGVRLTNPSLAEQSEQVVAQSAATQARAAAIR